MKTKILQIGSGSMGTRRMRDMCVREDMEIGLFDPRHDRRERAQQRFNIECFSSMNEALVWKPDAFVISTPPDQHAPYVGLALQHGIHFFCEAEIWTYNYLEIEAASNAKGIVAAPSCTFYFHPIINEVRRIVNQELGNLHAYSMCLSVDEPRWHPDEGMEYYARHRSTAAGREMVPFELIGLHYMFGEPQKTAGTVKQRGNLGSESEDTWCLQMEMQNGATGQLSVLMASPHVMRKGWVGGTNGFIEFDLLSGDVIRQFPKLGITDIRNFGRMSDILEAVYANEINTFMDAVLNQAVWPFTYRQSSIVTGTLAAAEKSAITFRVEPVDPTALPALLPNQYELK